MADVLYENHQTGTGNTFQSAITDIAVSQSFVAASNHIINKVSVYIKRFFGVGDGVVWTVALYAADANNHPTGSALATYGTFVVDDMSSSTYTWFSFYSGTYTVTSGSRYAVVLTPDTYVGDAALYWYTTASDDYATGLQAQSSGGAWSDRNSGVNDGYFKCIHDTSIGTPAKPTNPTPANSATGVDFSGLTLSWDDGGGATSYNVYIGTTGSLTKVSDAQVGTSYVTTIAELETVFGASPINQKIYWRVDATNGNGTTTGDEWNFDPRPVIVSTTTPANAANDVTLDGYISLWDASSNADSYDLYFGTLSGFTKYVGSTSDLTFNLNSGNNLTYNRFYYWKVVAVNDFGYTDSGELTFSTIAILPPSPTLWDDTEGWYRALSSTGIAGDEGVDWESASNPNIVATKNRLVAFVNNRLYYDA